MRERMISILLSIVLLALLASCKEVVFEEKKDVSNFLIRPKGEAVELCYTEYPEAGLSYRWYSYSDSEGTDPVLVFEGASYTTEAFSEPGIRHFRCQVFSSETKVAESMMYHVFHTGLPVVSVDTTTGKDITEKTNWVDANISIISGDETFEEAITIKGRGNSSWAENPKKGYNFKLPEKTKLLGMSKSKKWALIANYPDYTKLGNWYASYLGNEVFNHDSWQFSCEHVDLVVNGEYKGSYILCERIGIESKRLDIPDIAKLDSSFEDLNGDGKVDLKDGGFVVEFTYVPSSLMFNTPHGASASLKDPDLEEVEGSWSARAIYERIKTVIREAEASMYGETNKPYSEYIDVESFVDWYLLNEYAGNGEASFNTSTYAYFDPSDSKVHMGPIWDFDRTFFRGIQLSTGDESNIWFQALLKDPEFVQRLKNRWEEKRTVLLGSAVTDLISRNEHIAVSRSMDELRWEQGHMDVASMIDDWIPRKIAWMDEYLNSL